MCSTNAKWALTVTITEWVNQALTMFNFCLSLRDYIIYQQLKPAHLHSVTLTVTQEHSIIISITVLVVVHNQIKVKVWNNTRPLEDYLTVKLTLYTRITLRYCSYKAFYFNVILLTMAHFQKNNLEQIQSSAQDSNYYFSCIIFKYVSYNFKTQNFICILKLFRFTWKWAVQNYLMWNKEQHFWYLFSCLRT